MYKGIRLVKEGAVVVLNVLVYPYQMDKASGRSCCVIVFMPAVIEQNKATVIEADRELKVTNV